ncbi:MAG: penicillin-binding protein [Bacteroidales bacterium]|nr:transpeptidase family protein [Bacteroidales bacterium]MDD4604447.1 penicillin-binding protein [Bacteroidales bacterium]
MKDIKKDILVRVYLVYLGVLLFGLFIIARVIMIQQFEKKKYHDMALKQEIHLFELDAIRGNICADNGTLLAVSIPIFEIRMDVMTDSITDELFRNNVDSLAANLSRLFKDKSPSEYKDMLWEGRRNKSRYLLIQRDVTFPDLNKMRKFPIFRRGKFKGGLIVLAQFERELPYKSLARRIIGYESGEGENKVYVGLEGSFTKNLQGINGQRLMRRVGGQAWMPVDPENQIEPQNGDDIITTFDINLQDFAESSLRKELIADSADHGCVILMEVQTGYLRAMANLGRTKSGTYEEIFNYAIGESQETGSTFKLASFLVALDDGKVDLETPVNCSGGVAMYYGRKMEDSHHGLGVITARQVFEKSSNVGTSKIIFNAYAATPQKFIDGLYRIGINRPLNLQIAGEGKPYIKNTKSKYWSALSIPWMSIGYEISLAPIHLLTLYNAVANNGVMVKPLFVREIRRNGQVIQRFRPEVINPQIVSPATIRKAQILLEGVVEEGTGACIKTPNYKIAGKTGTAQLAANNKGYRKGTKQVQYKGTFVGYFPADHPKYTCIVVINNPKKGKYYGGSVAAPVFRELSDKLYATRPDIVIPLPHDTTISPIPTAHAGQMKELEATFAYLNMTTKSQNSQAIWAQPEPEKNGIILISKGVTRGIMPDVTGMGLKDALYLLEQQGLRVLVNGKGMVIRQSIPPQTFISKGLPVIIELQMKTEKPKSQG